MRRIAVVVAALLGAGTACSASTAGAPRALGDPARTLAPSAAPSSGGGSVGAPSASPAGSLVASPAGSLVAAAPAGVAAAAPAVGMEPGVPAQRCVSAALARLSLRQRAGQVLMIGVPVGSAGSAASAVRTGAVGGVFLAGRSRAGTASVARQVRALQAASRSSSGIALHVAVDQEGGQVQTLRGPGFGTIPAALEQGRWSAGVVEQRTRQWSRALRAAGVTMNLAPVADTVAAADARRNPPIGAARRQYGSTPAAVAEDVAAAVRGEVAGGVVPAVKHFPGLGRVRVNTDTSRGATDPVTSPTDPNLRPFAAGVAAGAGAVMMSSASYPRLDRARLAMFSPVTIGLLRERLGFTGVVVSDDLGAAVAVREVPVGQRAVRFVAAGGDLVLTVQRSDAPVMRAALVAQATRSATFRHRLDEAARHVLESKARAGLLTC